MRNLFILILSILAFTSCSKSVIVLQEKDIPEDIFYLDNEINPYSGKCIVYFTGTEIIKEEFSFKNGILDGVFTSYYRNGNKKILGNYTNGHFDGKWEAWFENGQKNYEVSYRNDTLCGDYVTWYATGVLKEKGLFAQKGKSGEWILYDEAGMIISKVNHRN